jgi:hypothetical protein
MQEDDDEFDGLNPTSMWRRSKKRKDYSDREEEEDDVGEQEEEDDDEDEDEEEGEEDHKDITNNVHKGKLHPPPIPLAVVRVVPPPKKTRQTARVSTGGKAPRHCLASRNHVINLRRRECMRVLAKDLPGEWDHHLPKRNERGSALEWKPSKEKIEGKLWEDLAKYTEQFQQAYDLMMSVLQDLQIHHDPKGQENEKNT